MTTTWANSKKWRSDSIEARLHAAAMEQALTREKLTGEAAEAYALDQVFRVMSWLYSMPYDRVAERIAEDYDVETSPSALARFWDRFAQPWLAERMRRSSIQARQLAHQLDRDEVAGAAVDQLTQQVFELLIQPGADPDQVATLFRLLLQSRKLDTDERRIALLEQKAREADEAKAKARELRDGGGLSDETLEVLEKRLRLL